MKFFRKKSADFDKVDKRITKDLINKPIEHANKLN